MQGLIDTMQRIGQYNWNAPTWLGPVMILGVVWTLLWKGIAMWKAAKNNSKPWFVVLLLINTVGILDIIYILFLSKKSSQ